MYTALLVALLVALVLRDVLLEHKTSWKGIAAGSLLVELQMLGFGLFNGTGGQLNHIDSFILIAQTSRRRFPSAFPADLGSSPVVRGHVVG